MGLLMGCAFSIKPVVTPEGCLAFALLTFPALWRRVLPPRRAWRWRRPMPGWRCCRRCLFALAYLARDDLTEFLDGSFLAPLRYAEARLSLAEALQRVQVAVLVLLWPMLLAGMALARWGWRRGREGRLARLALVWFGCGCLAIIGPGLLLPALLPDLDAADGDPGGAGRLAAGAGWPGRGWAAALFVALVAVVAVEAWRQEATVRVGRGFGIWLPDPVAEVAEGDPARGSRRARAIFIANYHPVVYALTDAALPTRFVFPAHLTGGFTQVADIDTDAEVRRILATKPRIVVVDRGWWAQLRPSAAAILTETLNRDYVLDDDGGRGARAGGAVAAEMRGRPPRVCIAAGLTHHPPQKECGGNPMSDATGLTIMAEGLRFPEGPIALPDGSVILVEIAAGKLTRVAPDGTKTTVATPGGGPNGIAMGPGGQDLLLQQRRLPLARGARGAAARAGVPADYKGGRIEVIDPASGSVRVLYDRCGENTLKGPNDIVFAPKGSPGRGRLLVQRPRQGAGAGPRPWRGLLGGLRRLEDRRGGLPDLRRRQRHRALARWPHALCRGDRDRPALGLGRRGAGRGAEGPLAVLATAGG